jgi:hypothetical protein
MHIAAVAWLSFFSGTSLVCSVRSARINPAGLRVSSTLLASARFSAAR